MGRQINQSLACCAMLCRQDTVSDLRWQHRNRITPGIESRLQCNARHPPAEIYGRKSRTVSEQKVDFAVRYAEMCNQKIQFLIHRIELLTMQSCRGRVIAYLLEKKDASNLVHVTVSREDLARQLGVSRAALFRELSTLQGRNAISAEGNTIHLSDVTLLEDILYHSNDTK